MANSLPKKWKSELKLNILLLKRPTFTFLVGILPSSTLRTFGAEPVKKITLYYMSFLLSRLVLDLNNLFTFGKHFQTKRFLVKQKCSFLSPTKYSKTNCLKIDYLRCWILHQFSNGANTANANAMHVWSTSFFNAVSCANLMFQFRIVAATHELSNVLENPGKKNLFRIWLFFSHGWYYQGTKQFGSVVFSQRNKPLSLEWIKCRF